MPSTKRKTNRLFTDRNGTPREFDPEDTSGRQRRYPPEWVDTLSPDSPARRQHERAHELHDKVHGLIVGTQQLEEYFDTGPVDGSGFRDLYSEHTPAFASGDYPTDLHEWAEMLHSIVGMIDLDYREEFDEEDERFYFDEEARETLYQPLQALDAEITAFLQSLEPCEA